MKRSSAPLVSSVPATSTTLSPGLANCLISACPEDTDVGPVVSTRAARSIWATGVGLRPPGRRNRIGHVDLDRMPCRRRFLRLVARRRHRRLGRVVMAVPANTKKPLLQLAVRSQFTGGRDTVDAAVDHDGHIVRDPAGNADVLLNHQNLDVALFGQANEHFLDLGDDDRRQSFGRLVHHQQLRIGQQRAGDRQHLLFAAGKLPAAIALALGKPREGRIDPLDGPGSGFGGNHLEMLVNRERAPQPAALRDIAYAHPGDLGRCLADQRLTGEVDRTRRHRHHAHDRLAQRGLAHAVAADNRKHAAFEPQVDALERVGRAVEHIQSPDIQRRRTAAFNHDRSPDRVPGLPDRSRSLRAFLP